MTTEISVADHIAAAGKMVEQDAWAPDLIIYHDKCADGIVAAWACWKRWGDAPEYRAANYGYQPPEDVDGKNILIVDFSWPDVDLYAMIEIGAKSIVILDHHKTARDALAAFQVEESSLGALSVEDMAGVLEDLDELALPPILALFDMERSGARLAWDFAHSGEDVPRIVRLAERYDLWRFQPGTMDYAELLHLVIQAGPLTIGRMEAVDAALRDGDGPLIEGAAIYDWRSQLVEEIAARAHLCTVAGIEGVIAVECPYSLVSAVGHHLLDKHPAAPFAAMSVTGAGAVTWSLRSHDDRMDVSEVAKGMGGGGHRNAAGFRVETRPVAPADFATLRDCIAEVAAGLSNENPFWTAGCLADALIRKGIGTASEEHPNAADWRNRAERAEAECVELRAFINNPPKHIFWRPGEPDCPREIKAGNGELHTMRCKVCGQDSPRDAICRQGSGGVL